MNIYYNGQRLEIDHKTLDFYDIKPGSTIYLLDLGFMIPIRLSKFIVNSGPPLIFWLFR